MFSRLLTDPDDQRWIEAPGHNETVSRLLNASFGYILEGARNPLAYAGAHRLAARCVTLPRSTHQNMLVSLALGLALECMDHVDESSEAFADAIDAAHETHDYATAIELHDQLGATLRCRGRFEEAADFYEDGLLTLHALGGATLLNDPVNLQLERGLAVSLMAIGLYDDALLHLLLARELARQAEDSLTLARLDLITANVHSARGDVHAALPLILAARDAFANATSPSQRVMHGRLHAIAAGALLDVAEVHARGGRDVRGSTYVQMAGRFAQQALNYFTDFNDVGGFYLGMLASLRHDRISGRLPSTVHLLVPLLTDAERLHDPNLAVMLHTAIGQDYAARGEWELAVESFRRALHDANACGAIFLGEYAKRELLRGGLGSN